MANQDLAQYKLQLLEWATAIQKFSPGMPILVTKICNHLGIRLKRSDSVPNFKAYLSVDPSKEYPVSILLPVETKIGKFERLCVAHQLAHYVLLNNYELLPKSNSEYWQHEVLCDDFARHLLIPDNYIFEKTACTPAELPSYLALCREIVSFAQVPWIHAAVRITEINPLVIYLRSSVPDSIIRRSGHGGEPEFVNGGGDATLSGTEPMFVVLASSLPRQKGIGSQIENGTPLFKVLVQMLKEANRNGTFAVQRDITEEIKCSISNKRLLPTDPIAFAEVERAKYQDVKIIITSNSFMSSRP